MYNIGQCVKLHTHDEYNGLYGEIYAINKSLSMIAIFCMNKPAFLYYVDFKEAPEKIEIINN